MRSASLLVVAMLSACAAESGTTRDWTRIQRDRLERLHAPRRPDTALADAIARAPRRAPQDPKHIDQREPPAPGSGPRPFQAPVLSASVGVGLGNVAVRIPGQNLDDHADARVLRVGVETGGGAALHATAVDSETELFPAERISDGTMPAPADASLLAIDAFPHLRLDTGGEGRWRMPVRLGAFADWRHLDHELANVDRHWVSLGPRAVVEPTWRVVAGEHFALDVVGHVGADVGIAWFRERFPTGDDRDTTARWGGEAGVTLRALFGRAHVEAGYQLQHAVFGATDGDLFGHQNRTEQQLQQVFVGFGLTY
jgi:hypothetical protein